MTTIRTRHVLGAWVASRLALVLFVGLSSYVIGFDRAQRWQSFPAWLMGRFSWADSYHYTRIADRGYLPPGLPCCDQAFFPGYPLAIRAVRPLVGGDVTGAGLLVAHLSAAVAAVLLWHLALQLTRSRRVAALAVTFLAVAPYGVFLTAVFTESLFLALALGAWLAAHRRHWWLAGLLAGLATLVRVNGLFLAAGLAVLYLTQQLDGERPGPSDASAPQPRTRLRSLRLRPDAVALLAPAVAVGGYVAYLHALTGSWTAWTDAQTLGWKRENAWPWQGLAAGWKAIRDVSAPDLVVAHTADLVTSLLGLVLLVVLLWLRRWPEAVYIGLNVAVLICSTTLQSAPRYALTWFPAYVLVAEAVVHLRERRGNLWPGLLVVLACLPLMAAVSIALAAHLWVA